jgi:hypothetical protein
MGTSFTRGRAVRVGSLLFAGALAASVLVGAVPASASSVVLNVEGTMSGPGGLGSNCLGGGAITEFGSGTFQASGLGGGTYSFSVCIFDFNGVPMDFGTITFTTSVDATLTGDTGGVFGGPTFDVTITGGTKQFTDATGSLTLSLAESDFTNCHLAICADWHDAGSLTGNLTVQVNPIGNIFATTFEQCTTLHVGYNRFVTGTVVHWTVTTNGVGTVASGQFSAIGGGVLGSKTYHFLDIPLGTTLPSEASGIQSHVLLTWANGGRFYATRDPGC